MSGSALTEQKTDLLGNTRDVTWVYVKNYLPGKGINY